MITRIQHLFGPLLAVAGLAFVAAANAAPQDGTTPPATGAAPAASSAAPATTPAPAPAATTTPSEEDAKKKKAAAAGDAAPTTAPAPTSAATDQTSTGGTVTFGTSSPQKKDEPSKGEAKPEDAKAPSKIAGTIFVFDQSITGNTLKKDAQLSYLPVYEWWLSPRFYWNFTKQFKVGIRQDLFKEWTNTEETTYRREWRYTDTWLSASYADKLKFISEKLRGGVSFLLRPGISKDSRGAGQYFSAGPGGSLTYSYDIGGEKAKVFKSGTIGASVSYSHAFTRCTTPCGSIERARMKNDETAVIDDQLRSGTLTGNTLIYALNAGLAVADKLDFDASMIWISGFSYTPPATTFGGVTVDRNPNDTRTRQYSWFLLSLGYDIMPEVNLAVGYYNLNNVLAPDGTYRNPFWSPDARLFFDVTFNVDSIYNRFKGDQKKPSATAKKTSNLF